jgi:hypothetical protein
MTVSSSSWHAVEAIFKTNTGRLPRHIGRPQTAFKRAAADFFPSVIEPS